MWPVPYTNLAKMFQMSGKTSLAIEKYEAGLRANPNSLKIYFALGELYLQAGEYQKAAEIFEKLTEKAPGSWLAANNLAFLLAEFPDSDSDLEQALKLATKALQLKPDEAAVSDTLGWIYYKQGHYVRSLIFLERSHTVVPENSIVNYHLGMALYRVGRSEEAKERLKKAIDNTETFVGKEEAIEILERIS